MTNENELFVQNQNLIWQCIHKHFPNEVHNEDLFQECSIGLLKAIRGFDETKSSFSTYAYTCIHNAAKMYFRKNNKYWINESAMSSLLDEDEGEYLDYIPDDKDYIAEVEGSALKDKILNLATSEQNRYIVSIIIDGYNQAQVSKELNCSRQYVSLVWRSFIRKCRQKLHPEDLK